MRVNPNTATAMPREGLAEINTKIDAATRRYYFIRAFTEAALTVATYCGLACIAACVAVSVVLIAVSGGLW